MKLYHYTDIYALKSILERKVLWLTQINFMNDYDEQKNGEKEIREEIEKTKKEAFLNWFDMELQKHFCAHHAFVGSFSKDSDKLSQWRGYCPENAGYCLEFDFDDEISKKIHTCIYEPDQKKLKLKELVEKMHNFYLAPTSHDQSDIGEKIKIIISTFKNSYFYEENESRFVVHHEKYSEKIKHRVKNNIIIPYIEYPIQFNQIKSIMIGPGVDKKLSQSGLKLFIETLLEKQKTDIPMPSIFYSKIPLRI